MLDRSKIDRIAKIVIAIGLIAMGVRVFGDPVYETFRYVINFGKYHEPIGIGIAVFGCWMLAHCSSTRR